MKKINLLSSFILLTVFAAALNAQSGGTFQIEKSVIAGGGGQSNGGVFMLDGTIGQSVAGTTSTGGAFELGSGFWGIGAPVSPGVTVSGRVTTPSGLGLRNAIVTMTDPQGFPVRATTSSFGIFSFDNIETGRTYIIGVSSRRYRFAVQMIKINGTITNLEFVGLE